MAEDKYSTLPFTAYKCDKDFINIQLSTFRGNRIIATDDTVSLPLRTLQFDNGFGYNRVVMVGPIYGRLTNKLGHSINTVNYEFGSGLHIRSIGNKFESCSELRLTYGTPRITDNLTASDLKKFNYIQSGSYITMYGRNPDNSLKSFEQFYERNVHELIIGTYKCASGGDFSYTSGGRMILQSIKKFNCFANNESIYDAINDDKLEINSGSNSNDNSIYLAADDNIVIYTKDGIVNIKAKNIKIESIEDIDIKANRNMKISASLFEIKSESIMGLNGSEIYLNSNKTVSVNLENINPPSEDYPVVRITHGYDEIPEEQKAIIEVM